GLGLCLSRTETSFSAILASRPKSASIGGAFDRPPAGGCNSHALDFGRPAACTHGFGLHVREPVTDKADQHGEREAVRGPEWSGAASSRRPVQHFERAPLLRIYLRLLRGRRH